MQEGRELSTSQLRRRTVAHAAVEVFARSGYATSPVTKVAERAGISPAYVMKLFPRKVDLFVAAIDTCYDRVVACLETAAVEGETTERTLDRMGAAYATLIADRDLLLLQVQAVATAQVPEVSQAVQRGISRLTDVLVERAGADTAQVQQFIARGQLCHVLTAIDAFAVDQSWAKKLTAGIRHES